MPDEHHAEHFPRFPLVPIGSCIYGHPRFHSRILVRQIRLQYHGRCGRAGRRGIVAIARIPTAASGAAVPADAAFRQSGNPCEHLQAGLSSCEAVFHAFQITGLRAIDDAVLFGIHIASERRRQPVYDREKVEPHASELVSGSFAGLSPSFSRHSHPEIAVGFYVASENGISEGCAERGKRGSRACGQSWKIGLRGFCCCVCCCCVCCHERPLDL